MAFRLARVLRLRTQLREWAQDEVGRARAALAATRERRAAAGAAQRATRAAEEAAAAGGITGAELERFRAFEGAARTSEAALAARAEEQARALGDRRQSLIARRREERQLEVLREDARVDEEAEEQHAAAVLLDELALRGRGGRRR